MSLPPSPLPPFSAEEYRPPVPGRLAGAMPDSCRAVLEGVLERPEIRAMASDVVISVADSLPGPFRVGPGPEIRFQATALADPWFAALLLRHAIELIRWSALSLGPAFRAADLLAARTAGLYLETLSAPEQEACRRNAPGWLLTLYGALARARIPDIASRLAVLRDESLPTGWSLTAEARRIFSAGLDLAAPVEYLIAEGGDSRLGLDPVSRLNAGECSTRPRPWAVTYSSSTASTISEQAYREAELLRLRLIGAAAAGRLPEALGEATETSRRALLDLSGGAAAQAEAIFCPSGTDAEFLALHVALAGTGEPLLNIVVAPEETGGGVPNATAGRHFKPETPLGPAVAEGSPLEGLAGSRVTTAAVPIRNDDGTPRRPAEIDGDVVGLVEAALAEGRRCLLHLVDRSKTGLGAPRADLAETLARQYPSRLDVVVDASQMRLSRDRMARYLGAGFMVIVTGSKFFTGPAFSGAVLLPPALAARTLAGPPLGPGLAAYSAKGDWPPGWEPVTRGLTAEINLGLMFRWRAALWEMRAFYAVPESDRTRIVAEFGAALRHEIEDCPVTTAIPLPDDTPETACEAKAWDSLVTIRSFTVARDPADPAAGTMGYDELRKVYRWLNNDLSAWLPESADAEDRAVAAKRCHIGQPVLLARHGENGAGPAALRLSIGAHLVSCAAFEAALGNSIEERLRTKIGHIRQIFRKIELIARRFDSLLPHDGNFAPRERFNQV